MFERFSAGARGVVRSAVERVERTGGTVAEEEDLFLAVLASEDGRAADALATLSVTARRASVERALAEARRRGGLSRSDTEALAGLGIDVNAIVSRVEQAHGEGALADRPRYGRWSRPARTPLSPGAKQLLAQALREALDRGDGHIGEEHLLLALTARPGVVSDVLAEHGTTHADVRRVLAEQDRQSWGRKAG